MVAKTKENCATITHYNQSEQVYVVHAHNTGAQGWPRQRPQLTTTAIARDT
jgi:hypothetical protein